MKEYRLIVNFDTPEDREAALQAIWNAEQEGDIGGPFDTAQIDVEVPE